MTLLRILPIALLAFAASGPAHSKISDRWPLVGFDRQADCELQLHSNRIAVRMDASGLIPGELLTIVVRNGAMKPLRASFRASADGRYGEFYAPLKSNFASPRMGAPMSFAGDSGQVDIEITASRCTLMASSPWTTVPRVIP